MSKMGQMKYNCKLCDFMSKTEVNLESHVLLKHNDIFIRMYDISTELKDNLKSICCATKKQMCGTNVFPPQFRHLYIKLSGVSCLQGPML